MPYLCRCSPCRDVNVTAISYYRTILHLNVDIVEVTQLVIADFKDLQALVDFRSLTALTCALREDVHEPTRIQD